MRGRIILWLAVAGAILFALQGGEYSSVDLYRQRSRKAGLVRTVDSLRRQVDSLRRAVVLVKTDTVTQERIAREEFGMVRGDKEILYRFGEAADSSDTTAKRLPD